jgi:hypothetical protein
MAQSPEQQVVQFAARILQAMRRTIPKLDAETAQVLQPESKQWGLSLFLAAWNLGSITDGGAPFRGILGTVGALPLAEQLDKFGSYFPATFKTFLEHTYKASKDYQLEGSAVYLQYALQNLATEKIFGSSLLSILQRWLEGDRFQQTAAALTAKFPPPASLAAAERNERFQRADFEASPKPTLQASTQTPQPGPEDIARVHLATLGWDTRTIDQALTRRKG